MLKDENLEEKIMQKQACEIKRVMLANTNAEKIKFILRNWPAYHALYEPSKANEVFRVKHETSAKRKTRGTETAPQWRNKSAHVKNF